MSNPLGRPKKLAAPRVVTLVVPQETYAAVESYRASGTLQERTRSEAVRDLLDHASSIEASTGWPAGEGVALCVQVEGEQLARAARLAAASGVGRAAVLRDLLRRGLDLARLEPAP